MLPDTPDDPTGGDALDKFKIFGREPTLYLAVLSSLLIVLGTFGFHWLSPDQAGVIVIAINAVTGAINALLVRPVAPAAFTYAIASIVAAVAAYGINVTPETLAAINLAVVPILALVTRNQVGPLESPVTKS